MNEKTSRHLNHESSGYGNTWRWLAIVAIGLASPACNDADEETAPASVLPVVVMQVEMQSTYFVERAFTGLIRSSRTSHLGFERGGLVVDVLVHQGDPVKRGQIIARLDTAQLRSQKRRLGAERSGSQAAVGIANLTSDRLERLAGEKFVTQQKSDEALFGLKAAQAQMGQLRAAMNSIEIELKKSELVAPYDGTVAERLVDEGTVVAAGAPIVRFLEEETGKEAVIGVPIAIAESFSRDDEYEIRVRQQSMVGRVLRRVSDVDLRTRTAAIILALPPDSNVMDGEIARLVHRRKVRDTGAWVPTEALTNGTNGLWSTFALSRDGDATRIVRKEVEVLHVEADRAFVTGTLENGDQIVAIGLHRVVPGQLVSVASATANVEPEGPQASGSLSEDPKAEAADDDEAAETIDIESDQKKPDKKDRKAERKAARRAARKAASGEGSE